MKILILMMMLVVPAFAQLDYSPKASNKEGAVKMHFAISLFRGVNPAQEQFLVRAIENRRAISETEARALFPEVKDIFFGIGRYDVSTFKRIYEKGRIAEKKELWRTLTKDEQTDVRRITFAWGVGYLNLNTVQIDYLNRFSKVLPTVTKEDLPAWEAEALALFPKEVGFLLFGSVGPYTDKPCEVSMVKIKTMFGNCPCSIGSSFNMSCDNTCSSPNGCTLTEDGCGFAWLYACNGGCSTGGVPINN